MNKVDQPQIQWYVLLFWGAVGTLGCYGILWALCAAVVKFGTWWGL